MARSKSQMTGNKRAREAAVREKRERKAEKKRAAREARDAGPLLDTESEATPSEELDVSADSEAPGGLRGSGLTEGVGLASIDEEA